jgi:flagellar hook-associated protein 2
VDENTTISSVVSQLQATGLNASFDEKNQRFFVSSKDTGAAQNFTLNGNNEGGLKALSSLGLLVKDDVSNNSEYETWAGYADSANADAYNKVKDAEVAKRAAAYKAQNETLEKTNDNLQAKIDALKADAGYPQNGETSADLYTQLYGPEVEVTGDDGTVTKERNGGLKLELDNANAALETAKNELAELKKDGSGATADQIAEAETKVTEASAAATAKQTEFNSVNGQYTNVKAVEDYESQIAANNDTINANNAYYTVDADGNAVGSTTLEDAVEAEFQTKIQTAQNALGGAYDSLYSSTATKVQGQDAEIYLNGAYFKSSSNTFEINGLTMTMLSETNGEDVTLSTDDDTDGIYDMIKNFFKEYNSLINEMDTLYNADSASGYEPLMSDEKSEMSDSEIEEWEATVKAALLRRDSTLGTLTDSITSIMLQGVTVNGKTMYLSDFGINTLGYFSADDNERHAYHIDGDEDDSNTKSETDVLKSMIASDPDTVINFFTGLANSLYSDLTNKMSASTLSSAFTVYNDKELSSEYDDYTDKISDQEDKLNDLIDKWYSKFSTMETALSKLDSKSSSLSSLLGS